MALFTQKHYEYLELALPLAEPHHPEVLERVVEILCDVFERDNPRFKREVFRDNVLKQPA